MAYRDDVEPLKERRETLSKALEQVREQSRALAAEERALSAELDRVDAHVDGRPQRRRRIAMALSAATASCLLLGVAAFGRLMTSEIAPFTFESSSSQASVAAARQVSANTPDQLGTLQVEAPAGSRIFEGEDELLGVAPFTIPVSYGVHLLKMVPPGGGRPHTKLVNVRQHGVTVSHFD